MKGRGERHHNDLFLLLFFFFTSDGKIQVVQGGGVGAQTWASCMNTHTFNHLSLSPNLGNRFLGDCCYQTSVRIKNIMDKDIHGQKKRKRNRMEACVTLLWFSGHFWIPMFS